MCFLLIGTPFRSLITTGREIWGLWVTTGSIFDDQWNLPLLVSLSLWQSSFRGDWWMCSRQYPGYFEFLSGNRRHWGPSFVAPWQRGPFRSLDGGAYSGLLFGLGDRYRCSPGAEFVPKLTLFKVIGKLRPVKPDSVIWGSKNSHGLYWLMLLLQKGYSWKNRTESCHQLQLEYFPRTQSRESHLDMREDWLNDRQSTDFSL